MSPRPGEVWLADLGMAAKTRPVVVVSRYDEDPPRVLVLYVPLTSEDRDSAYEVKMPKLPFLRLEGVANVQGIGSLPVKRLERRLGVLPYKAVAAFRVGFGLAGDSAKPGSLKTTPAGLAVAQGVVGEGGVSVEKNRPSS